MKPKLKHLIPALFLSAALIGCPNPVGTEAGIQTEQGGGQQQGGQEPVVGPCGEAPCLCPCECGACAVCLGCTGLDGCACDYENCPTKINCQDKGNPDCECGKNDCPLLEKCDPLTCGPRLTANTVLGHNKDFAISAFCLANSCPTKPSPDPLRHLATYHMDSAAAAANAALKAMWSGLATPPTHPRGVNGIPIGGGIGNDFHVACNDTGGNGFMCFKDFSDEQIIQTIVDAQLAKAQELHQ
ncbi:MAG: hypothetical protein FWD14_00535 [Treponema sp.]|nr:hypothetical protein [Treponema sp.]